jgi:signal transduction histidine kinase
MKPFRDVSIQRKLVLIMMLTATVTLVLACVALIAWDWIGYRRALGRDLASMAEIVASNSTAALAFGDQASAEETLAALRARPGIVGACLYDRDGAVFARYARDRDQASFQPPLLQEPGTRFALRHVEVFQPVLARGETVGTAYLRNDLSDLYARLARYAGIAGVVALAAAAVALAVSTRLQRVISQPILDLARVARVVSADEDYTVRGTKRGGDEIGQLIDGFNTMLARIQVRDDALQRANQELESFGYSVSHDLRVPVRAVNGLCQVLEEEHGARLDPEGRRLLGLMRDSARQMGQLIDDLLDFSRLGGREMHAEGIDMTALATEVVDELLALEANHDVEVIVAPLAPARGDPALLRQVFVNLVSNALKFTRRRSHRRIEIGSSTDAGATTWFVRDNGVGFDMKYAHKLFQVFQRLHPSRDFEGTGVGLAIVRRIVERHGGRIWAEASPEGGAVFSFTLAE